MLTLYRFTDATCANKILLALAEKKVQFEDRLLTRADLGTEEYRRLNPNGVVPTIVHDDAVIIESSVILNYIEDSFDGIQLRPGTPLGRATMNYWLKIVDDALEHLGTVTYAIYSRKHYTEKSKKERERYYSEIPDFRLRESRRNAIELGLDAPEVPSAIKSLMSLLVRADAAANDREFLAGEFSLADISLTPFAFRLETFGLLGSREELPGFHRWWDSVRRRPSFHEAIVSMVPIALQSDRRAAAASVADRLLSIRQAALAET